MDTDKPKTNYKRLLFVWLYIVATTPLAFLEIDDMLRIHYTSSEQQQFMSLDDVKEAIKDTPAGKALK